jgi:KaiC/GvpD/RAD55 family RecA-like ATPase
MEFLVRGITEFDEPGVFVAFEESVEDLVANVASLGFDLSELEASGRLIIDHVGVLDADVEETGEWDLDGLFVRLGAAIDEVGAKRVVIDTIETLFGAFEDSATLRAELRRLFAWLKERKVTAVITGERGDGRLTRYQRQRRHGADRRHRRDGRGPPRRGRRRHVPRQVGRRPAHRGLRRAPRFWPAAKRAAGRRSRPLAGRGQSPSTCPHASSRAET